MDRSATDETERSTWEEDESAIKEAESTKGQEIESTTKKGVEILLEVLLRKQRYQETKTRNDKTALLLSLTTHKKGENL